MSARSVEEILEHQRSEIERVATIAAKVTREVYESNGYTNVLSYRLARLAAQDRGLRLCSPSPHDRRKAVLDRYFNNVGSEILDMIYLPPEYQI